MGVLTISRLGELVDDVLWRGLIGITHAEVDDIFTPRPGCRLQFVDDIEDIRRQAPNSGKGFHLDCGHGYL